MDLIVAWLAFPALLLALACGAGVLVERLTPGQLPGGAIPLTGAAALIVVASFFALADATAELMVPAAAGLALAGFAFGRWRAPAAWAVAAGVAAYACFAAPIALSGEATFAGYVRLDDTATWLAITDHVIAHGRDLDGLAPSTYEATLAFNLGEGYPIGVFLPLAIGVALTGVDPAWLIQPYMAVWALLLALALWELARRVAGPRAGAAVAVVAAQAALLYGYYLWGGIKEIAAAALIAGVASLAAASGGHRAPVLALAVVAAALVATLSAGGGILLVPMLAGAAILASRLLGARAAALRALALGGAVTAMSLPTLVAGGLWPPASAPLLGGGARGNLFAPLEPVQLAGIWPSGDFRVDPTNPAVAFALVTVALAGGAVGLRLLWTRRAAPALLYAGGSVAAALAVWVAGSPWTDAKALAIASPAVPFAAGLAAALLWARAGLAAAQFWARAGRAAAAALALALGGGVAWSNVLAARDASLAPRGQLVELERIGKRIAGEGPTLMTEYQPYGVRHFLREADPEGASELRRRPVTLADGSTLAKGEWADTDELRRPDLLVYRTLVLRRRPAQSRPPSVYRLVMRGEHYDVWQRPEPLAGSPRYRVVARHTQSAISPWTGRRR